MNFQGQNSVSDNQLSNLDITTHGNRRKENVAVDIDIDDFENTSKNSVGDKTDESKQYMFNRPSQFDENFNSQLLGNENVFKDLKCNKPTLISTNTMVSNYFNDQKTFNSIVDKRHEKLKMKSSQKLSTNSNTLSPFKTSQKLFSGSQSAPPKILSSKTSQRDNFENSCNIFSSASTSGLNCKLSFSQSKIHNDENDVLKKEFTDADEFSQFYKNSQVTRQIDEIISKGQQDNISNCGVKRKFFVEPCKCSTDFEQLCSWKETSQMFEKMEETVCKFGFNQANKSTNRLSKEGLKIDSNKNNFDKVLRENANKSVVSQVHVNNTVHTTAIPAFQEAGPFYGLPNKVKELIHLYKGIDKLYDWQNECLNLSAVKEKKNLIYSLPTSGGKTLVAEILLLQEIICRKHDVIFILPYVAIVQEKVWALSPFAVALDFLLEEYAAGKGVYPPKKRRYKNTVYIATSEKALGLVNSLVEMGRLEELGLIIVDELHLIGDAQRGYVLETLLTKLMILNNDIQIVGMSATIGNLMDIAEFLNAEIYHCNFRPVELIEYVKCGNNICKLNWNEDVTKLFQLVRTTDFSYSQEYIDIDPDHLGGLIMEVVPNGSCLIFCPSKQNCENVTLLLCKVLPRTLKQHKIKEKEHLLKSIQDDVGIICDILKTSILYGIAYHHSGLTTEERKLIEEAYRAGILCVICCTSTLATGVNLPAKRVIIRKPYIARDFINLSRYKQMVGRAGRTGLGENGDSFLIFNIQEFPRVRELLTTPMDQTLSHLHMSNYKYLEQLYLSCIALGTANTYTQLEKVTMSTLLSIQKEKLKVDIVQLVQQVIVHLFRSKAIKLYTDVNQNASQEYSGDFCFGNAACTGCTTTHVEDNLNNKNPRKQIRVGKHTKFILSKLGNAALKGGLNLEQAHTLYRDLKMAQNCLILDDCLHLLYLVIPYGLVDQIKPSPSQYYNIMIHLNEQATQTAKILGISNSCIRRLLITNQTLRDVSSIVLNRFYMSLMLYELWNEIPITEVSIKYEVNRGFLQTLMTSAASFSINVINFCEQLENFWPFVCLLRGMNEMLAYCCSKEILPLMELPAVKQSRAKQLYNAGFKNLQSIAKADPNVLVSVIGHVSYKVANQLIAAAKMLLLKKIETLREEAEDVVDGIENSKSVLNQTFQIK